MIKRDDTILHIILLISDMVGAFISAIIAFKIRYGLYLGISKDKDSLWIAGIIMLATLIMSILISPAKRFIKRSVFSEIKDVVIRQALGIAGTVLILYLAHTADILSRLVFGYYSIASVIIITAFRLIVKAYITKVYKNNGSISKVIVIANGDRIPRIIDRFSASNEWERIVTKTLAIDEVCYEGVVDYAVRSEVDEAFISIVGDVKNDDYQEMVTKLVGMGIKVDIDIDQFEMDVQGKKALDEVGNFAVVSIARNALTISQHFLKRIMDILGGIVGTAIFLIALIIVGPIIKLESEGPIIFTQKRVGKNGRLFSFYKFRSMYKDAEARKKELMEKNEVKGLMFKMEDDPRITKVGKFIRKTSIDELPQFLCVLKGDMSLVGTRPPTMDEYEKYEPWHKSRLSMKPGITGLWQVSGRSDIKDFDEVVRLDMEYIDNWSIWGDIKILFKTVAVVLGRKGSR